MTSTMTASAAVAAVLRAHRLTNRAAADALDYVPICRASPSHSNAAARLTMRSFFEPSSSWSAACSGLSACGYAACRPARIATVSFEALPMPARCQSRRTLEIATIRLSKGKSGIRASHEVDQNEVQWRAQAQPLHGHCLPAESQLQRHAAEGGRLAPIMLSHDQQRFV